jgi:hypothetical protein
MLLRDGPRRGVAASLYLEKGTSLIDVDGRVIGINQSVAGGAQGIGFATAFVGIQLAPIAALRSVINYDGRNAVAVRAVPEVPPTRRGSRPATSSNKSMDVPSTRRNRPPPQFTPTSPAKPLTCVSGAPALRVRSPSERQTRRKSGCSRRAKTIDRRRARTTNRNRVKTTQAANDRPGAEIGGPPEIRRLRF